jgi:hypothetical protein
MTWQMQAPEVTVVLRAGLYVTLERRQALFEDWVKAGAGPVGGSDVVRQYKRSVSRSPGGWWVKLAPIGGNCGVEGRLESPVYRGLVERIGSGLSHRKVGGNRWRSRRREATTTWLTEGMVDIEGVNQWNKL